MRLRNFSFGSVEIGASTYEHDIVIDHGKVRERDKKPSKTLRHAFGHTPLSLLEEIPWKCRQLVIGTGAHGQLPVTPEVRHEAERRRVELVILPTPEAIAVLNRRPRETNAILHLSC
jgi:hypothetical protein